MKQDRKKAIITTAAKLFRKKGFHAVSMRDLAQELGIKAASLYNHITSKQEILAVIVLAVAEDFTKHMEAVYPNKNSAKEKLEAIIENHIEITLQKNDFLACMNNDWVNLKDNNKQHYLQLRNAYEHQLKNILEEGMKQNEFKTANVQIVLFSLLSTLRTLYLWYSKNSTFNETKLKQDLKQTLLTGIVNK